MHKILFASKPDVLKYKKVVSKSLTNRGKEKKYSLWKGERL